MTIRKRENPLQTKIIDNLRNNGFWVRKKEPTFVGDPDVLALIPLPTGHGIPIAMEVKRDELEGASPIQQQRLETMRKQGWHSYLVTSWECYLSIQRAYSYRCPTWKVRETKRKGRGENHSDN